MKLLGITMAYNEEDCVGNAINALYRAGADVHVFDHGSTDATPIICQGYVHRGMARYHYLDRCEVPAKQANGGQSRAIWMHIARFVIGLKDRYDWVTWIAADEIVRDSDGTLFSVASLERESARGIQVIRPLIREFWITKHDPDCANYLERLRYYRINRVGHAPRCWRIELTPSDMPLGLHLQDPETRPKVHPWYGLWPNGTRVSNNEWLLDHYPMRSVEQGKRKLQERNWINPAGRRPYDRWRRSKGRDLVLDDARLRRGHWVRESRELSFP